MRPLPSWQRPLLGLDRFPSSLTDFEVEYFFSFSDDESQHIHSRRVHLRVGAAIQLGFMKMTGNTLDVRERIPLGVMLQLSKVLRTQKIHIATPRSLYPRRSTLYEHQLWAAQCLGWHAFSRARRGTLVRELTKHLAQYPLSVDDIVELIKCWLNQRSILIPASRTLSALAFRLYRAAEREVQRLVVEEVPSQLVDHWLQDVMRPQEEVATKLEWLQLVPRGRTNTALLATLSRVNYLNNIGVNTLALKHVTVSQQRFYAHRLRNRRPGRLRTMPDGRARLELVCFLFVTLLDLIDRAIALFDFRATDLRRQAYQRVQDKSQRHDASLRATIVELLSLCDDEGVSDRDFRDQFRIMSNHMHQAFVPQAERVRRELVGDHRRISNLIHTMDDIPLYGTEASRTHEFRGAMGAKTKTSARPEICLPSLWQPLYDDSPSGQHRHVLSALTLVTMQRELRNGALWPKNGLEEHSCHQVP